MQKHSDQPKATCEICGKTFIPTMISLTGRSLFPQRNCDPCNESPVTIVDSRHKEAHRIAFHDRIPRYFKDTDKTRLPKDLVDAIDSYQFTRGRGLGFTGESGKGKTRAMYVLLKRLAGEGRKVEFITFTDLAHCAVDQFSDNEREKHQAKEILQRIKQSEVLFIDDLAKSKMTERVEATLYDILDHRLNNCLPVLWTTNACGEELHSMFSHDRADAIMRRLSEKCDVVT